MYVYFVAKYSYRGWKASSSSFSGQKWALFFIILIPVFMFLGNLFRVIGFIIQFTRKSDFNSLVDRKCLNETDGHQIQNPFNVDCLETIDYFILICLSLIAIAFILTITITLLKLMINLGRHTFTIILDSINGLIDLGIPEGLTILHVSARAGNTAGCRQIMQWKPDYYNKITINGESAFSFAAHKGYKETCELIVEMARKKDGTINDFKTLEMAVNQNRNGLTALHKAVEANHPEVVNHLVRHSLFGLQITNLLSYDLQTPLDIAVQNGLDVSVAILKDNGGKDNESIIQNVVNRHDNRIMYFLLKGTIDRRKFKSFYRLLKAGFDPSGKLQQESLSKL